MKMRYLLALAACFVAVDTLQAAPPATLSYQSRLLNASGARVNGTVNITIRIYDALTGGTKLWEETLSGVTVTDGIFSVILGKTTSLANLAFDKTYFTSMEVGTDGEMSPRVEMASAPYAMNSLKQFSTVDTLNTELSVLKETVRVFKEAVIHPGSQLTANSDGTITDRLTGLVWMGYPACWGSITWNTAIAKIAELNAKTASCPGYTGLQTNWRLPKLDELRYFVNSTWLMYDSASAFEQLGENSMMQFFGGGYWTTSSNWGDLPVVWDPYNASNGVGGAVGRSDPNDAVTKFVVLPVRDGP